MLTRGLNLELPEEASDESETENDRNVKAGKQKQKIVETLLTYEPPKTVSLQSNTIQNQDLVPGLPLTPQSLVNLEVTSLKNRNFKKTKAMQSHKNLTKKIND